MKKLLLIALLVAPIFNSYSLVGEADHSQFKPQQMLELEIPDVYFEELSRLSNEKGGALNISDINELAQEQGLSRDLLLILAARQSVQSEEI